LEPDSGARLRRAYLSPDWLDIEARQDGAVVLDERLHPTYFCHEVTVDDWCWMGRPMTVSVTQ